MANEPANRKPRLTSAEFHTACQTAGVTRKSRSRSAAYVVLVTGWGVTAAATAHGIDKAGVSRIARKIAAAHRECPTCGRGFGGKYE